MTTPSGLSIVVIILLVVLVLLVVAPPLEALIFSLPSGRVKCITEDLRAHSMSVAHYRIIIDGETTSSSHRISVKVSDPKGENVHLEEGVEEGRFAFVAAESGPHNLCFWSPKFDISFASLSVELDWTVGVSARDWPAVAKKDKIQDMENELKKLEESVHLIHEDMLFLRERRDAEINGDNKLKHGLLRLLVTFPLSHSSWFATMAPECSLQKGEDILNHLWNAVRYPHRYYICLDFATGILLKIRDDSLYPYYSM